jgi:hypothetical protein
MFEDRGRPAAAHWFDEHHKPRERAFKLALAVFNRGTYQSALDAAAELEPLFLPPKRRRKATGQPLFDSPRADRLAQANARVEIRFESVSMGWSRFEPINLGSTPIERIELHNPALPPAVLEYVWLEHDRAREPVLQWLDVLGGRDDNEARARAAATAGKLSTYGFRHVYNRLIGGWAHSNDLHRRESAAWALGVPAGDPELAPVVLAVLRRWSAPKSPPQLKHAAAVAYGAAAGLLFPEAALRGLRKVAKADGTALDMAVADSMASLFEAGHHDDVLQALEEWTNGPEPGAHLRARRGAIAYLQIAFTARMDPVPEGDAWPALLVMTERDERRRARTIRLWERTLDVGAPFGDIAIEAWRRWVRLADKDRRLLGPLRPMVVGLCGRPRHREQLRAALRKLADDARKPSPTASELLRVLDLQEAHDAGTSEAGQALQRPDPLPA